MKAQQFFKFALSLSQKLLCYKECNVKIQKSPRKFRKVFLSNLYLYVISSNKIKFKVPVLKITRFYFSVNSSECVLINPDKSILIDDLSFREILKQQLKYINWNMEILPTNFTILDAIVQLGKNQQKEEESIILNLDNLSSQYIERNFNYAPRSFRDNYAIENLIQKRKHYIVVTVHECGNNQTNQKRLKQTKQRKKSKYYTVKIYPFKLIGKNEKLAQTIFRQRRYLQQILSPYTPLLERCMVGHSTVYCISEYYKGQILERYVKNQNLNSKNLKILVAQITMAVGHIHQSNFIYNNINAEGIFITEGGYVLLNQFDYCREIGEKFYFQQNQTSIRPPEVFTNSHVHQTLDWWALGLLIFQLKQNRKWKEGETISWPKEPHLSALVCSLLQSHPQKRLGWRNDYQEILAHQYFKSINKRQLVARRCQPLKKIPNINYGDNTNINLMEKINILGKSFSRIINIDDNCRTNDAQRLMMCLFNIYSIGLLQKRLRTGLIAIY